MARETFPASGYHVERLLGRGATSEVWLARTPGTGDRVALKRIGAGDAEQRRAAHAEAALLASLDHPNLVRLLGLVPAPEAVVLVLDFAGGGSLADLLASRGRLTPGEVTAVLSPVAAAVEYLHQAGVVHGDVSAANILFTAGGVPLLADVGTARITGRVAATPCYVDPLVAQGQLPGPPSDVFMLAGVALHALTGQPTWPTWPASRDPASGGASELAERVSGAGVPSALRPGLLRALAPEPGRRGTALELARALRHAAEPVVVELAAGHARPTPEVWTGPRHAAPPRGGPQPTRRDDPRARPAFERPGPAVPGGPPPTRRFGPRPRPTLPRPPRGRHWARVGAAGLAALAALGTAWWLTRSDGAPAAKPPVQVQSRSTEDDWPATLTRLDAARGRAFAHRDATLLRAVYAPGALLAADTALLARTVPVGCVLTGVRTRYRGLRVVSAPAAPRVELVATATLTPSTLVCGGHSRGYAAGRGPVVLRLQLVRTRDGVRIVSQRPG